MLFEYVTCNEQIKLLNLYGLLFDLADYFERLRLNGMNKFEYIFC